MSKLELYDLSNNINKQYEILVSLFGDSLLKSRDLGLIKGVAGCGKSKFASSLIDAALSKKKKVLYVNTELSESEFLPRFRQYADNKNFGFLNVEPILEDMDGLELLEEALEVGIDYNFDFYIIDQLADFVSSVNDELYSKRIIKRLNTIARENDCAILSIIHQNEGGGIDSKARGHLGSLYEQKASIVFAMSKKNDKFAEIKTTKRRGGAPLKYSLRFEENGDISLSKGGGDLGDIRDFILEHIEHILSIPKIEIIDFLVKSTLANKKLLESRLDALMAELGLIKKPVNKKMFYFKQES